ncbi:MAG TPA: flagellar motor protein MotB, partial [Novimethylophilus sp.]
MAEDNIQPIIVKKIKKGGHGHHGGAWKIAYADFVTAMMAFFLLMWLLGSTTKEQKQAISDYFNNPSAVSGPGGASTSMIKIGGGKDVTHSEGDTKKGSNKDERPKETQPAPKKAEVGEITKDDKQRLLELKKELENAIDASEALKPFKDQLLLEITKEGLRIQIIDKENRPMFNSGSSVMQPYASEILKEIGKVINHVPNKISLSGHTDATPYSKFSGIYTNWELSADRSNASRRALISGGMDEDKVARVVGLSSAVLFDKDNPYNPINRRISIIVLNKETEDAILHDEGKLDQTSAENNTPVAAAPAAPDKKPSSPAAISPAPVPAAPAKPATAAQPSPPSSAAPMPSSPPAAVKPAPASSAAAA